jgi:septal ring factor EnvC (AmiA/AmiB activator)
LNDETEGRSKLQQVAIQVGIYAGTFLAGALVAFVYSYAPLHSGKNWEIGYLEERLQAKETTLEKLTQDLARIQSESADKPDGETFKLLQSELATTDKTIKNLERKLDRTERKVKELERSRKNWKAKYAALEAERSAPAEPAPVISPAAAEPAAVDDTFPASPGADTGPPASGPESLLAEE